MFTSFGATIATYVGQNEGAGYFDRVKKGIKVTQLMILAWSVVMILLIVFCGRYLVYIFISPEETEVIEAALIYFRVACWAYPMLGSIFLYRNALQGMGYGLVPMLGGVFELVARASIIFLVAGHTTFAGICLADPAAWVAALIPLIPYYIVVVRKRRG